MLGSTKAWIIGAGTIAAAVTGILLLVFLVFPDWKPCFGDTTANFTDVTATKIGRLQERVSYTIVTHGYEGKGLRVVWSLSKQDNEGSYVQVPGFVRLPGGTLEPTSCSTDQGGDDLPVAVVERGKYLVVLELFPPGQAARPARAEKAFSL